MLDAATQAWLDQEDRMVAQKIREYGTFLQYVFGEVGDGETPFCYTVGLFGMGHPELLVFGLGMDDAAGLLNEVTAQIRAGRDLAPGELVTFDSWQHRVLVEEVPNPGDIVFTANRHYDRPCEVSVPVFQLTFDDRHGRFPWDPGYSFAPWVQPRPGEFHA